MPSKPAQLTEHNASAFQLQSVVDAYHLRTPYPPELAEALLDLDAGARGPVLDLGCGTGEIARALAPYVSRIDAVDISAPMLERARSMSGGDVPSIRWIESAAESLSYEGPYSLAVSGDALHWMDWDVVLPAIAGALAPGGQLVLVSAVRGEEPWSEAILDAIRQHSVITNFESYSLVDELTSRGLVELVEERRVGPAIFERSIEDFVGALHATSGLARDRMAAPDQFDDEVREIVIPYATDGVLTLQTFAQLGIVRAPGA